MANTYLNKICNKYIIYSSSFKYKTLSINFNQHHYYLGPPPDPCASVSLLPEVESLSRTIILETIAGISVLSSVSISISSRCASTILDVIIVSKASKYYDTCGGRGGRAGSMDDDTCGLGEKQ
jgi:hypothetical protein